MPQREGETCLYNEVLPRLSHRLTLNCTALQWLTGDRLFAGCGNTGVHRQFNLAKTVYRCLQYNFEEGGSTNEPELFMMVRREIAQSRCETGTRSREAPMRT